MEYDKELIAHKLQRWDKFITDYHLPDWETIPDFGLYMDQVIVLLEQYLSFIPAPVGGKERFVTSSTGPADFENGVIPHQIDEFIDSPGAVRQGKPVHHGLCFLS